MIPPLNTKILAGKLKENDLEKFLEFYSSLGFKCTSFLPSLNSVNETNEKLGEFEITPDPFFHPDNKLIIGINHFEKNFYVHPYICIDDSKISREARENYDKLVRDYFLK